VAELNDDTMARIRHATVFLDVESWVSMRRAENWSVILNFLRIVATKMPHLKTLRIAVQADLKGYATTFIDYKMDDELVSAANRLQSNAPSFRPSMPASLADMPLIQRGGGYQVGYSRRTFYRSASTSSRAYAYKLAGQFPRIVYDRGCKVGVYTYACDIENSESRFWSAEEVAAQWPMREYPEAALEKISAEKAEKWAKLPLQLVEWERGAARRTSRIGLGCIRTQLQSSASWDCDRKRRSI
jgi:hypothetical protein